MASIDGARPSESPRCRVPSTVLHGTAVLSGRKAAQFNAERYGECVTKFHAGWYTGELRQRRESSYEQKELKRFAEPHHGDARGNNILSLSLSFSFSLSN